MSLAQPGFIHGSSDRANESSENMSNSTSFLDDVTPVSFQLSQNYPNPFKGRTKIKYCVPYKTRVVVTACDAEGNEIETLVDEEQNPGTYEIEFNAAKTPMPAPLTENSRDALLRDNVLFYRLEAGEFACVKKMEMIK